MAQNEVKMVWNPALVLLRCPKILQASSEKAKHTESLAYHLP